MHGNHMVSIGEFVRSISTFERLNRKVVTASMSEIVAQKLCTPSTKTRVRLV